MDLTLNCFLLGCFENYSTRLVELSQTLKCQKNFHFINLLLSLCHLCFGTDFRNCLPVLWTSTDARQFIFKCFRLTPILTKNLFYFQKQVIIIFNPSWGTHLTKNWVLRCKLTYDERFYTKKMGICSGVDAGQR